MLRASHETLNTLINSFGLRSASIFIYYKVFFTGCVTFIKLCFCSHQRTSNNDNKKWHQKIELKLSYRVAIRVVKFKIYFLQHQ